MLFKYLNIRFGYFKEIYIYLKKEKIYIYQVYKYETGNDIYVSLGKTIRSVNPNH